jgi:hypothetical protein
MVQLYCLMFTFIVFVGNGWLALLPAHLPQLRLLDLELCCSVSDTDVEELVVALPQLVILNRSGDIVGRVSNELQETLCHPLDIRQLDRYYQVSG